MNARRTFKGLVAATVPSARTGLHTAVLALLMATGGCLQPDDPTYGVIESQVAVSNYTTSGCSTSVVVGLSRQIAAEIACMNPGSLVEVPPSAHVVFTSNAVLPFMSATGKSHLLAVAATHTLHINSVFRAVPQQYLLYRWYQQGRCGITAAATPGRSNHQSGRAVDLSNYSSVVSAMASQGWAHDVPGDDVHFDHTASPDIRGRDVKAFQQLWNRNHPNDVIAADGAFGPATESRLKQAPATGFAIGPTCGHVVASADVLMIDGPERVAPLTRAHFQVTVANKGTLDWPATTKLRVIGGVASELYDSASWDSPKVVGAIGSDIGAGAQGVLEIDVMTPAVTVETPISTQLELVNGTDAFGTINLALTVTPNGDEDTSNDAVDQHDDGADSAGCDAGGAGGAGTLLLMPALVGILRRRNAARPSRRAGRTPG